MLTSCQSNLHHGLICLMDNLGTGCKIAVACHNVVVSAKFVATTDGFHIGHSKTSVHVQRWSLEFKKVCLRWAYNLARFQCICYIYKSIKFKNENLRRCLLYWYLVILRSRIDTYPAVSKFWVEIFFIIVQAAFAWFVGEHGLARDHPCKNKSNTFTSCQKDIPAKEMSATMLYYTFFDTWPFFSVQLLSLNGT